MLPSRCHAWTPGPRAPSAETAPGWSELFPAPSGALGTPAPKCKRSPPNSACRRVRRVTRWQRRGSPSARVRCPHHIGLWAPHPRHHPPSAHHSSARRWCPTARRGHSLGLHATRAWPRRRRSLDHTPPCGVQPSALPLPRTARPLRPRAVALEAWVLQLALAVPGRCAHCTASAGSRSQAGQGQQTRPCGRSPVGRKRVKSRPSVPPPTVSLPRPAPRPHLPDPQVAALNFSPGRVGVTA